MWCNRSNRPAFINSKKPTVVLVKATKSYISHFILSFLFFLFTSSSFALLVLISIFYFTFAPNSAAQKLTKKPVIKMISSEPKPNPSPFLILRTVIITYITDAIRDWSIFFWEQKCGRPKQAKQFAKKKTNIVVISLGTVFFMFTPDLDLDCITSYC